jgi:hypothetical protein
LALILMVAGYLQIMTLTTNLLYSQGFYWIGFSLAVVGLIWWIAYRYINNTAAIVAALMSAFNPWTVFYSAHPLNVIQLGLLIGLVFTLVWIVEQKPWAALMLIMFLGIIVFFVGGVIIILIASGFPNQNLLQTITSLLLNIGNYVAGLNIPGTSAVPRPGEIWLLFLGLATFIGLPALWLRLRTLFTFIVLWIVILIGLALIFDDEKGSFILIYALPTFCLLAGAGVAWLIKLLPGKPYSRMIVLATYGAIFLSQGLWWQGVVRYLQSNP